MEEKSCRVESLKRVRATCREFAAEDVEDLSGGELEDQVGENLLQNGGGLITYYTTYRCDSQITAATLCVKCHVVVLLRCRRKVVVLHRLHRSVGAQSETCVCVCEMRKIVSC